MDELSPLLLPEFRLPRPRQVGAGNLTVSHRYGPGKCRRMLPCRTCKARFSERKGTPLFDARLPPEKVESVLETGEDAARADRRRAMAEADPGDGRQADRSCLVVIRMDQLTGRTTQLGHHRF